MEDTKTYYHGAGQHQKLYNLAMKGEGGEKENAIRALEKRGLFVDIAGIVWSREEVEMMGEKKQLYYFRKKVL